MRVLLPALAAALLVPALASPAGAQGEVVCGAVSLACQTTLMITMVPLAEPLAPTGASGVVPVVVEYSYFSATPSMAATPVDLAVTDLPPWLVASVTPTTLYMPTMSLPCFCTVSVQEQAFLLLSATADAPAFQQGIVELQAVARENGMLSSSVARNAVPVQAGFFAITEVAAPREVALAPGSSVDVAMTVASYANGLARVSFEAVEVPPGLQVAAPAPVVLESRQQGGQKHTTVVTWKLRATGDFEPGPVILGVRSAYALDSSVKGDSVAVQVHVAEAGGGDIVAQSLFGTQGAPSPVMVGVLFAGMALAVVQARRRLRE